MPDHSKASWFGLCTILLWGGCAPQKYLQQNLIRAEQEFKDHIGFALYDPLGKKMLFDYQGDQYFTPASNTKIFTLFASLNLLGDSIASFRYAERPDSLIIWGTGDPSFLYGNIYPAEKAYRFLRNHPSKIFLSNSNFQTELLGPGWAWGDYQFTYQVERTPFPIYGNRATVIRYKDLFISVPEVFTEIDDSGNSGQKITLSRDLNSNHLTYTSGKTGPSRWQLPFHFSYDLVAKLLSDTLRREVRRIIMTPPADVKTLYGVNPDSLYKVMMQESDNFIAEQLLLLCAGTLSDTLKPEIAIQYAQKNLLADLPDESVWVDGSGLSRYNLFTPRSIVRLWEKLYGIVPQDRLFALIAVGGRSGTLKHQYNADRPFIYGKTGSLSNNHNLSGFLVTKKGRTLIFSWMNNNFTAPSGAVRNRMESVLRDIYEKY